MAEISPGNELKKDDYVVVVSNLPYGERIGDEETNKKIYKHIKELMHECSRWSFFLITSDKKLEMELGRKADRRRKLYNGNIETQFYQFHGEKPRRYNDEESGILLFITRWQDKNSRNKMDA